MPWCVECDRFLNPNTVTVDGACPACGEPVVSGPTGTQRGDRPAGDGSEDPEAPTAPWHFWLLVVCVVVYLGWRFLQGGLWLLDRLW